MTTKTLHNEAYATELKEPRPPHEVFDVIAEEPYAVFLDSGMDRERLGRYSFLASRPVLTVRSKGDLIEIERAGRRHRFNGDPFKTLSDLLWRYNRPPVPGLPPFQGGFLGFFSYDLGRLIERIPDLRPDDTGVPDIWLGLYPVVLAFDHLFGKAYVFVNPLDLPADEVEEELERVIRLSDGAPRERRQARTTGKVIARTSADTTRSGGTQRGTQLRHEVNAGCGGALAGPSYSPCGEVVSLRSNFTREQYCEMVRRAREYIFAGDIFQVNLSQRFTATFESQPSPWTLYRELRRVNPAPFAAFLGLGGFSVASLSPERFLRLVDGRVETRPIKGTRPRGRNPEEEKMLRRELENSEKDRAELLMIVDLERNDIGRVCRYGSVRVPELFTIETYPTVFHLVATVVGELDEGKGFVELLRACFPGGSITGAPKVRAMEIIEELEPVKRGIYTGSIGYIDLSGNCDLNIVIRTLLIKGNRGYLHVGGGIVADSDPEAEYEETIAKGRAFLRMFGGIRDE